MEQVAKSDEGAQRILKKSVAGAQDTPPSLIENIIRTFRHLYRPQMLKRHMASVAIALISILVLVAAILVRSRRKKKSSSQMPPGLSETDRQRILKDIKQWLNHADGAQES